MYAPGIGRFISADTIVPGAGNPQALNRYSYALGNPLKYVDPTGHSVSCGTEKTDCGGGWSPAYLRSLNRRIAAGFMLAAGSPALILSIAYESKRYGNDKAGPYSLGWQFFTGLGPNEHNFAEGDSFTDNLKRHPWLSEVRSKIGHAAYNGEVGVGRTYEGVNTNYYTDWNTGNSSVRWAYFAKDMVNIPTNGWIDQTSGGRYPVEASFMGGFDLSAKVTSIDHASKKLTVSFTAVNTTNIQSATHNPGDYAASERDVAPFVQGIRNYLFGPDEALGPMRPTMQTISWSEVIDFEP